jgi:hypothetical protein
MNEKAILASKLAFACALCTLAIATIVYLVRALA